jgi:GST-like protein
MIDLYTWSNPNGFKVQIMLVDIACFPWMRNHQRFGLDVGDYPNVGRWLETIAARPAVKRELALL